MVAEIKKDKNRLELLDKLVRESIQSSENSGLSIFNLQNCLGVDKKSVLLIMRENYVNKGILHYHPAERKYFPNRL